MSDPTVIIDRPPNHLVMAILSTLCCCLPAGIVAIVYAAQVDGKVDAGDIQGAQQASYNAKMWSFASIGVGVVAAAVYAAVGLATGGAPH